MCPLTAAPGLGWVPERPIRRVAGKVATAAKIGALIHADSGGVARAPFIWDQRGDNSCTGHNGAAMLYGLTGELVSPEMLWTMGRLCDGATVETLSNTGVRSSAMLRAFRKHGSCHRDDWHRGMPEYQRDMLPPALCRIQAQRWNLTVDPIYATGQRLVALIIDALAKGLPCGLVVEVDRGFDAARGMSPVGPESGASRGKHIITPWKFVRDGGAYMIGCANSWGVGHGDRGVVWLSQERVGQSPFACIAKGAL